MKLLSQAAVGTDTPLYIVPVGYKTELTNINIANTTAAAVSFSLHLVPPGDSSTTANMLFPAVSVNGNTLVQWTGLQHLTVGYTIKGTGTGITVTITGDESRDKN